jgi:hypothetical protein
VSDSGYVPPPPFAPPPLRVAPLNETAVLGRTSYPHGPFPTGSYGYGAYPPPYGAYPPPPVAWPPPSKWQPRHLDGTAHRRRRTTVLTGMAVITALVAICAVLLSNQSAGSHPRSLTLPTSVDNYTMVRALNGAQVRSMFTAGGGTFGSMQPRDLDNARVGVYTALDDSDPTLLFIGFSGQDSPTVGERLRSDPPTTVTDEVLSGTGATAGPTTVDAGPLGGAMRCADIDLDGQNASVAVWADHDTLGIVLVINSASVMGARSTTAQTSAMTRDFRAKAEH